jgi:hypothetical protein
MFRFFDQSLRSCFAEFIATGGEQCFDHTVSEVGVLADGDQLDIVAGASAFDCRLVNSLPVVLDVGSDAGGKEVGNRK